MNQPLVKKIFLLGIILMVFGIPIFANGEDTPVQDARKFCFVENFVHSKSVFQECYGSFVECDNYRNKVLNGYGQGNDDYRPNEGDSIDTCRLTTPEEGQKLRLGRNDASNGCGIFNIMGCVNEVTNWAVGIILWILAWILWLANQIFNLSIQLSISNFSKYANSKAITSIWSMGRDLANVFFIFILMYIAIATIIQKNGINTKKMVVDLIITALLINFSIIIPKVIIDVGNSLAIVFYKSMGVPGANGAPDIGGTLIRGADPARIYGKTAIDPNKKPGDDNIKEMAANVGFGTILLSGLTTGVLILVLSYVLLLATYFFLVRTITLLILIATSSLAFFSRIVPLKGMNFWDDWFNKLIKEVFFAPAFLFMFYLVLKIATEPDLDTKNPTWTDLFIKFILLVGLSFGSIMVAKKMATWSGKLGEQIKDKVAGYGGAWVARNTAGRAASGLANSEKMKNWASSRIPLIGGLTGKYARRGLQNVASAKFGGGKDGVGFLAQQEQYAKKATADMEDMTKEQKASYVKGLSSIWTGKETQESLKIKTADGSKDKLKAVMGIKDEELRKKVLKGMSEGDIAKIAMGEGGEALLDTITDVERRQKIEGMMKKEQERNEETKRKDESGTRIKALDEALMNNQQIDTLVQGLKRGDIKQIKNKAVIDRISQNDDILLGLSTPNMLDLIRHKELANQDQLVTTLKRMESSPARTLTPEQKTMLKNFTGENSIINILLNEKK
jgi:hypothetical protein